MDSTTAPASLDARMTSPIDIQHAPRNAAPPASPSARQRVEARPHPHTSPYGALPAWGWALGILLVLLATVFRAGNRHVPLIGLEWLALGVLVAAGWQWLSVPPDSRRRHTSRTLALAVVMTAPYWLAAIQLMPWPGVGPLSHTPSDTWLSMLAALPVLACLVLGLTTNERQLTVLLKLWIAIGVVQAILGLLQLSFPQLRFEPNSNAPVLGTFGNRNGLANFLAMLLPVTLLGLLGGLPRQQQPYVKSSSSMERWIWCAFLLLMAAGLLATQSRMGIATGALAVLLSIVLLRSSPHRHHGAKHMQLWWLALPSVLIGVALLAGGWEWLNRFDADRLVADDTVRAMNRAATWEAVKEFWPWGSGLGSFVAVFPRFQHSELGYFLINYAHNDYLQLLMETGVLLLPAALALVWLVVRRIWLLTRSTRDTSHPGGWSSVGAIAVVCSAALLAQILHAWMDYPWRIPANAMLGAFMLGCLLREPHGSRPRQIQKP